MTTVGWTSGLYVAWDEKPQSAPAMTFSRPTSSAKRTIRSAISSGCSTMLLECVITPGMSTLPVGQLHRLPNVVLVLVARVGRLERVGAGVDPQDHVDDLAERHVVHARALVDAVAGVEADLLRRDAAQRRG